MRRSTGFTLIELMVVLAVMAALAAVVAPQYVRHVERAKELVLRQNLRAVREGIDQFKADRGRFPQNLQELVSQKYLRGIPFDPVAASSESWVLAFDPTDGAQLRDVHSGAPGTGLDGTAYASW